jgi:23S rRNA pseudoU1915 N3-methylase RlmH
MKYGRWIIFGLVAIAIVGLWLLVGANKNLRQRIEALLLERLVKNKVQDLRDKATEVKAKADAHQIDGEKAQQEAAAIEKAISEQKAALQSNLESRGLDAEEIANRFRTLNL